MSIDHSDQLHLPDAPDLDPSLEASVTPKFDMCLFRSTLTEKHVENFSQIYAIPLDLHPHAPPAGFTMDQLSNEHIGLYVHHFRRGGLRVPFSSFFLSLVEYFCVHISQLTPLGVNHSVIFEMYCRALNITPTVPLFRVFYKLCKQGNWFSFQNRVGKGLKPCIRGAPTSLKKWKDKFFLIDRRAAPIAMSWRHHDSSVADVLPGPSEYNAADVATLLEVPIQLHKPYNSLLYIAGLSPTWKGLGSVPIMKGPGGEVLTMAEFLRLPDLGACKIVAGALLPPNFPVDNHLANPAARPKDIPPKTPAIEKAEVACPKVIAAREKKKQRAKDLLASKAVGGNQGWTTEAWTYSFWTAMEKFRQCRDMMSNIFTPADLAFFNEGMDDREAVRRSWKLLYKYGRLQEENAEPPVAFDAKVYDYGQLSHDYEDALRREEALKVKVAELEGGKKSSNELVISSELEHIKILEVALRSLRLVSSLRSDREKFAVAAGQGEAIHKRLVTKYFPTFIQRLIQSNGYKESVGEVLSLAVGKGFIDGISLGRTKADVDALLKASPGVNPASSDLFMGEYLKLFEMYYPYVDKVTRAYFLDPSELQNIMQDGTGPTPGGGPRPSPTAHS
ncbi:hypothetical protein Tco_0319466 [Tanacetum coccineum]